MLHDVGKASDAFQTYIRQSWQASRRGERGPRPGTAPHAIHGALLLWRWLATSGDGDPNARVAAPLIVLNHHGQVQNASDVRMRLQKGLDDPELRDHAAQAVQRIPEVAAALREAPPGLDAEGPDEREILTRLLASALIDADRLDTEAFANPSRARKRQAPRPRIGDLAEAAARAQQRLHREAPETPLNAVRRRLYEAVVARAGEPPGVFRLTVPTGGGKTRTALAFALEHARRHGLERVVIAIPFTSIIEQNVDVYRTVLGDDAVLEHHSNVDMSKESEGRDAEAWRLPTETWDVPVVVTTTVQLFDSLFSNRTSVLRKIHRLARSVIVLDEAQTLPAHLLDPIVSALGTLTAPRFGASVVLCTATQPALDVITSHAAFRTARELAPDPSGTYRHLARVYYELRLDGPSEWGDIAAEMAKQEQALCIVNTVADARNLAELVGPDSLHLSTRMCAEHRRAVLAEVRDRLAQGASCRLVSTQLIEAGVDVDFPVVYRALAPLDAIAQAAGRCNREGVLEKGRVVVFEPREQRLPPQYRAGTHETRELLRQGADLHDPATFRTYFATLYGRLSDTDPRGVQELRRGMRFASVAESFRMIEDDTMPVVVRAYHPQLVDPMVARFDEGRATTRDLRALQPYLVQLRPRIVAEAARAGWLHEVGEEGQLRVWHGRYDARFGLEEGASEQPYVI
jgi:CRISPR-associated endonuclease/helicase Cas3